MQYTPFWRYFWYRLYPARYWLAVTAILGLYAALHSVFFPYLLKAFIDVLLADKLSRRTSIWLYTVLPLCVAQACIYLVWRAHQYIESILYPWVQQAVMQQLFSQLSQQTWGRARHYISSALLPRMCDVGYAITTTLQMLGMLWVQGCSVLAVVALLTTIAWWLGSFFLLVAGGVFIVYLNHASYLAPYAKKASDSRIAMLVSMSNYFAAMLIIRLCNREAAEGDRCHQVIDRHRRFDQACRAQKVRYASWLSVYAWCLHVGSMGAIGYLHHQGLIGVGEGVMVLWLSHHFIEQIWCMMDQLLAIEAQVAMGAHAYGELSAHIQTAWLPARKTYQVDDLALCVSNLSFSYADKQVIDNMSLFIPVGTKVGLVGESGAGKSTLLQLISRLLSPDKGVISLGGCDMAAMNMTDIRRYIAYMPQTPYIVPRSVIDNLRYGCAEVSEQVVYGLCQTLGIHERIISMPQGYHTRLGSGVSLSQGQQQRIALIRTVLQGAPIVLLDEVTSAVDPITEQIMQSVIMALPKHTTVIMVSHKQQPLSVMDKIYDLDKLDFI